MHRLSNVYLLIKSTNPDLDESILSHIRVKCLSIAVCHGSGWSIKKAQAIVKKNEISRLKDEHNSSKRI